MSKFLCLTLLALAASAVPAQTAAPPGAHDVLGIRAGHSSAADVRRILADMKDPRSSFTERREALAAGRFATVPGSTHLAAMLLQQPAAGCPGGSCERISVLFSDEPGAERALLVYRDSRFPAVPVERLVGELTQRWGTPSWRLASPTADLLAWYWDGSGVPVTGRAAQHAGCKAIAEARNVDFGWIVAKVAAPMATAGCAGGHLVHLLHPQKNGLVANMQVSLLDAAGLLASQTSREQRVQAFKAQDAAAARAAAAGRTSPRQ